jgi:hypothetical protein
MKYRVHLLHKRLASIVNRKDNDILQRTLSHKREYVVVVKMTELQKNLYRLCLQSLPTQRLISGFQELLRVYSHPACAVIHWAKRMNKEYAVKMKAIGNTNAATNISSLRSFTVHFLSKELHPVVDQYQSLLVGEADDDVLCIDNESICDEENVKRHNSIVDPVIDQNPYATFTVRIPFLTGDRKIGIAVETLEIGVLRLVKIEPNSIVQQHTPLLQVGDLIIAVNGKSFRDLVITMKEEVANILQDKSVDAIEMLVLRIPAGVDYRSESVYASIIGAQVSEKIISDDVSISDVDDENESSGPLDPAWWRVQDSPTVRYPLGGTPSDPSLLADFKLVLEAGNKYTIYIL